MNIRIYMLGTGTAVPIKRGLPCIVIRVDSDLYLLDAGEGCQSRIINMGLGLVKIRGVFITHMHGDHYLGLFGLLQSMHLLDKKNELTIIAPVELINILSNLLENHLVKMNYEHSLVGIRESTIYSDNKVRVTSFQVEHSIPSYGFLLEIGDKYRIVYSGDTAPCNKVIEVSEKADLLIHEATFTSRDYAEAVEQKHSTARDAALIASKANVKNLVLTHISPRYSDYLEIYRDAYRFFKNTIVAEDYMTIFI